MQSNSGHKLQIMEMESQDFSNGDSRLMAGIVHCHFEILHNMITFDVQQTFDELKSIASVILRRFLTGSNCKYNL